MRIEPQSPKKILDQLDIKLDELLPECNGVIVQDYAKGLVNQSSCQRVIEKAKAHNKKVVVDPYRSTPLPRL